MHCVSQAQVTTYVDYLHSSLWPCSYTIDTLNWCQYNLRWRLRSGGLVDMIKLEQT